MKIIADANILFSLVKKGSATEILVKNQGLKLISVDFVLEELENHTEVLLKKSGFQSFNEVQTFLQKHVVFVKASALKKELREVANLVSDETDLIYFALAKKYNFVIWSNDKHFKEQDVFEVLTTKELIEVLL